MKSYIEPLNAADALDVLDLYGIDTPGAFFSSEHEGCVEVELSGHTALLETPESVAMLFGHDAATALCQHSNFRRDAAEIMSRALDLDDFLYNVYSGTAFIPDKAPDGEFFGFHVAHIPLSAILEDDIDPLSPDACDYGLDSISETTEDAAVGYFDPAGAVDDGHALRIEVVGEYPADLAGLEAASEGEADGRGGMPRSACGEGPRGLEA